MPTPEAEFSREDGAEGFWTAERIGRAVRAAALLMVLGASLPLLLQEALGRHIWLDGFLAENKLGPGDRNKILVGMCVDAALFPLVAAFFVLRAKAPDVRELALAKVRRFALVTAPLSLLSVILPLGRLAPWEKEPLLLSVAIAVVVLLFEQMLARSIGAVPDRAWTRLGAWRDRALASSGRALRALPLALVLAGALGYGVLVTALTVRYHDRLGTAAFDLGGYDNIFYNALKGHPLRGTVAVPDGGDWSSLRVHAELSTYVFLPFYALKPCSETLLAIQAFTVGLGAVPIYLLAARRVARPVAVLLSASYLLFAPMHGGNFYDFHFQPLGSTLILWSFCFVDLRTRRGDVLFALFFAMALGCREDVSLSFAVAGMMMLAAGYRPLVGLLVAAISVVYFGVIRFAVMPHFGSWWFQDMYKDLLPQGDASLFGVAKTVVSNPLFALGTLLKPEKLLHVLQIFVPLAFLPLRRAWLWFGFVPAILGTLLTTGYHPTTDTTFQYVFYWVPFLFVGTAIVLQAIGAEQGAGRQAAAVGAMTLATLLASYHWGVVFQHRTFNSAWGHIELGPLTPAERTSLKNLEELGGQVPRDASFALTEMELAHFSNRVNVLALRYGPNGADYVLYRTGSGDRRGVDDTLGTKKYERVGARGEFVLLKRIGASGS